MTECDMLITQVKHRACGKIAELEVKTMADKEKQILQNISAAMAVVPEEKKEFFLGFAEGAAAMAGLLGKTVAAEPVQA